MTERKAVVADAEFQTREAEQNRYIEGYFSVFGSKYWLWDDAYETVEPGAFDLDADRDVRALADHNTAMVLGRTTAGTLDLKVDDRGLWGSILINEADQDAVNLYERVKRGDITQCSFGFSILDQDIEQAAGMPSVFHIRKVKLYEVSVVAFPAYEDTAVTARKAELAEIEKRKAETWRNSMMKKLKGES